MTDDRREKWQWQEPGRAWKGAGLYHFTMTVTDRRAVLGRLETPDGDPGKARVVRTPLGDALVDCLMSIPRYRQEVRVLHFCLMPDHLHAVLYVQRTMEKGIGTVARGFWQAAKKLGRAALFSPTPSFITPPPPPSFITPNDIRGPLKAASLHLQALSASLQQKLGTEAYYRLPPVFTEMPFIRAMSRRSQLPTTIRYLDMNPQRLATKRLKPGFFRVQKDIDIGGRLYDGVGNVALLQKDHYATVHVRHLMVEQAAHGNDRPLRDYKNGCVLKARQGEVMVSPFISQDEKQVMQVMQREQRPFILITSDGFRDYYKPTDALFDDCASGRLLILSPWPYDSGKRHITRADCIALNIMAEEICNHLNGATKQDATPQ